MEERSRFRWIGVVLFHFTIVLFTGFIPALRPSEESRAAFYNNPDKALNACILQWNLNTVQRKWNLGITEAPIFFPCQYGKFFSEHLFAHMVYAFPISLSGASPQTVYNLTYETNRLTIGIAASLLCLEVGAAFVPALLAGGLLITSWKFGQIQNTGLCWALLAMLFFIRQMKFPGWINSLAVALFFTLTALSSGYLAFYTPLAFLLLLIVRLVYKKQWPKRMWVAQMCLAAVIVSFALAPTMMSYKNVQNEYRLVRKGYTAARLVLPFQDRKPVHGGGGIYQEEIAFTPIAAVETLLFVAAVVLIFKKRLIYDGWEWGFFALAILSFWMAFYYFSPYLLIATLPGFNGLRAAYRWYLFWVSGLTVIISMLFTTLSENRQPWTKPVLIGATICLLIYAGVAGNQFRKPVERLPESHVYSFLRTLPPGPVCIFPVLPRGRLLYQIVNADRMLYQLSHSFPMVSGYSGFVPELTRRIERTLIKDGASPSAINKLAQTGVRYIIVDNLLPDRRGICNQLRSQRTYKILYDHDQEMIVELPIEASGTEQNLIKLWSQANNDSALCPGGYRSLVFFHLC